MKRELLKNTILIAIGKFGTQVISYLLLPLYTSVLSTDEYGTFDFIVTLCILIVPFVTMLIEDSMFRFLIDAKEQREKDRIISNTFIYSIGSLIIWSIVLFVILNSIHYQYTTAFILYIVSCISITLMNSITRGVGKFGFYTICNCILSISTIVLNVTLITVFKLGVNGLLWSTILSNIIISIFMFFKMKVYASIRFKFLNKYRIKDMLKYSYPLTINSVGWSIINISDRIIITFVLGAGANGIYAIANKFPNILNTFSSFFFLAFKENVSKAINQKDYKEYYNSMYKIIHNLFVSVSLLLIVVMPFIFHIFINEEFMDAKNYIPILIIALYYGNIAGYYGSLLTAFKDTKIIGKSTLIGSIFNIVINVALIKFIGIYAAVISTLISNYITNLYRTIKIRKYIKLTNVRTYYISISLLVITTIFYYINNLYINIISLVVTTLYCLFINRGIFISGVQFVKEKLNKSV